MVRRSSTAVSVVAWALVVCVAAGVTWAVIDSVGGNLGAADQGSSAVLAVPTASSSPGSSPSPSPNKSRSASPTKSHSQSPSASPSASPTKSHSQSPTKSATEDEQAEVWHGSVGLLSVHCDGRIARLESATPANGYGVEVEHNGTRELEAKFESSTREVRVNVTCADGEPVWSVGNDD
jgi:hypothetical protein